MYDTTIELFKYNKLYTTIDKCPIKNFTIYGERHCGTKWIEKTIKYRFDLPYTSAYDHKHFFGCCDWKHLNTANTTLFIGVVRNIYSWIKGMRKIPYHLITDDVLSISPWESIRTPSRKCDSHWYTKNLYLDIFDMRYNKNYFLYYIMPYLVNNYIFIRYEDFIIHHDDILSIISDTYGLKKSNLKYTSGDSSKLILDKLPKNYLSIINEKNNWKQENTIGYNKVINYNDKYLLD
jgi:hypothetical protein